MFTHVCKFNKSNRKTNNNRNNNINNIIMTKLITVCIIAIVTVSCKPKADVNKVKEETMKLHDVVMAEHSKIIDNQMKIDTLLRSLVDLKGKFPTIDTAVEKAEMTKIYGNLVKAEESMNDWMHNFNANYKDELETEILNYYKKELDKISKVDLLYQTEIKKSSTYLSKFKK